jgi:hypothetical protein
MISEFKHLKRKKMDTEGLFGILEDGEKQAITN